MSALPSGGLSEERLAVWKAKTGGFRMKDLDPVSLDLKLRASLRRWKASRLMQDFHDLEGMLAPIIMSLPEYDGQGTYSEGLTLEQYEHALELHALFIATVAHLEKNPREASTGGSAVMDDFYDDISGEGARQ